MVPLCQELRKTVYVRKVRSDDHKDASSCAVTSSRSSADCHQLQSRRRDHVTRQFARFRQLVKNIPAEQIVDVSSNTLFTSVYSGHLFAVESPTELNFPPKRLPNCVLKIFLFGRDNESQMYHGNFLTLMDNKHRKLFVVKQSKGAIYA